MTAESFARALENSRNGILKSAADSLGKWSRLAHNKECLELFLNHNIARVEFVSKDGKKKEAICCSNTSFVRLFNMNLDTVDKKELENVPKMRSDGMKSSSSHAVYTWNLLANDYFTIPLKSWKIVSFVEIDEKNMLLVNEVVKGIVSGKRASRK